MEINFGVTNVKVTLCYSADEKVLRLTTMPQASIRLYPHEDEG